MVHLVLVRGRVQPADKEYLPTRFCGRLSSAAQQDELPGGLLKSSCLSFPYHEVGKPFQAAGKDAVGKGRCSLRPFAGGWMLEENL